MYCTGMASRSITIGGNPGFTALTFTEDGTAENFTPAQITTDQTGLGTLVSVALALTVDTGGTRSASSCRRCN